jgi:allophanate hydrolase
VADAHRALDRGISGLRAAYLEGLDPVEVVRAVVARIDAADDPAIWIDREPLEALEAAAMALDADRPRLPLWGVPFGVKDNIDVAGCVTSGALPGFARRADGSATVVQRLLDAGAIYVGKTNLDQLATGLVGTRSPYGTPRNTIDPTLVPGGSSSGSAVAVALRQVPFALATDTAGSGRVPAALNGIVGVKGAPGDQPLDGVLPASPSIDCVSSFATTVEDGLLVEAVIAGVAWDRRAGPCTAAVAAGTDPSVATMLQAAGHQAVTVALDRFHEVGDMLYGGPWLAERTAAIGSILEADLPGTVDVVRQIVAGGHGYTAVDLFAAKQRLAAISLELSGWWELTDVLVAPTITFAPTLEQVAADPVGTNLALGRNTTFANLLGLAAITIPAPAGVGGVTIFGPSDHRPAIATVAADLVRLAPQAPQRLAARPFG